jgi:general stress protein YciG
MLVVFLKAETFRRLVQPVLPSIVAALPLMSVAPRLASVALEALGELAEAAKSPLKPWIPEVLPHIMETMQDQSSASKQRASLRTLGQIAGSTGYVIKPYLDYPRLLSTATDVLPGTKRAPWELRREVIRTLGILGALDPDQYQHFESARKGGAVGGGYFVERDNDDPTVSDGGGRDGGVSKAKTRVHEAVGVSRQRASSIVTEPPAKSKVDATLKQDILAKDTDDDKPVHLYMYEQYAMVAQPVSTVSLPQRLAPSDEEFYPTVAIQALTRIFKDPSLAVHHDMVLQAIMFIFNSLGQR